MPIPLPKKPKCVEKNGFKAVIEVENLYPGYGMTLGNTLRRVLLSSLEGAAVTLVKIKGVSHEFSTIAGVMEDVVEILLNLKQLRLRVHSDEPQKIYIKAHGEGDICGKDVETPSQVEVVNPSLHIATLTDKKSVFEVEMTVEKGFGYVPVEAQKKEKLEVGAIALDAIFTPVKKISYHVENMRVGERTDFDRVRFMIETDGTIDPEESFLKAASILVDQFGALADISSDEKLNLISEKQAEASSHNEEKSAALTDAGISTRAATALSAAGIFSLEDIANKTEKDILALEGMGAKSVAEIKKALKKKKMAFAEE